MYSMQYNLIITVRPLSTNQYDFNTSYVTYHMCITVDLQFTNGIYRIIKNKEFI